MNPFLSRIVQAAADFRRPASSAMAVTEPQTVAPTTSTAAPRTIPVAPRGAGPAAIEGWLASLPEKARPLRLARDFPRLADKLVLADGDAELAMAVLDRLMIDDRGSRQGFPVEVASELMRLRTHYAERHGDRGRGPGVDWGRDARGPRLR